MIHYSDDCSVGSNEAKSCASSSCKLSATLSERFGGKFNKTEVFASILRVKFFRARHLGNIYFNPSCEFLNVLGDLPVVGFMFEDSVLRNSGVRVGDVLLKINNIDVHNPSDVGKIMKQQDRPFICTFYVPDLAIVRSEGAALVNYKSKSTKPSTQTKDWKYKYVVIGGFISESWMMNMYRSRAEFDRAVVETEEGRQTTVKVKQFSLIGSRLLDDYGDPKEIVIKGKEKPWRYIVLVQQNGSPIKIAAPTFGILRPVHDSLRRVFAELDAIEGSQCEPPNREYLQRELQISSRKKFS